MTPDRPVTPAPTPTRANTAAVIVTYCPGEDSPRSLAALRDQVGHVFIFDNGSPPEVYERLSSLAQAKDARITLLTHGQNLGIALALNMACMIAQQAGYAWALLLDQDSLVSNHAIDTLAQLHAHATTSKPLQPIAILAGNYRDATGRVAVPMTGDEPGRRVPIAITSGSLLNLQAFAELGPFRGEYFIDEVDHEFCLRARQSGCSVWLSREPALDHQLGSQQRVKLGPWNPAVSHHSATRRYYMARNRIDLFKRYITFSPGFVLRRLVLTGAEAAGVVLLERDKIAKLAAMTRGMWHGLIGRMGPVGGTSAQRTIDGAKGIPEANPQASSGGRAEVGAPAEVAVLICAYNGNAHLRELLPELVQQQRDLSDTIRLHVFVIDDAGPKEDARELAHEFPSVIFRRLEQNLAFAGANNRGWEIIQRELPTCEYVTLLNMDTRTTPRWLPFVLETFQQNSRAAAVQSKLRLHPEASKLNTAGNRSHFLGFGFMTGFGEIDTGQYDHLREIDFPSGAAVTLRASVIRELGLFDESLGMYLEDAELGWRLRLAGFSVLAAPMSVIHHKYTPTAPLRYYYNLERNRWLLMLSYPRKLTIALILPAMLVMEVGQILFALMQGLLGQRLRIYRHLLSPAAWRDIRARRARLAAIRKTSGVTDRQWFTRHAGTIDTQVMRHPLLVYVGNPLLAMYWAIVKKLVR